MAFGPLQQLLAELKHPVVRDLAWVIGSPPLVQDAHAPLLDEPFMRAELQRWSDRLLALDRSPAALEAVVAARFSNRLGEYFEKLVEYWIRDLCGYRIVAQNIQVHGDERTVGEFDLIFDDGSQIQHWEMAVKLYLGHRAPRAPAGWIGPNPADWLAKKWPHMRDKQLRLARTHAGRDALAELGVEQVEARGFFKGYLLEPLNPAYAVESHPNAHPSSGRGWWVHERDIHLLVAPRVEGFLELPKLRWLSPALSNDTLPVERLTSVLVRDQPRLLALMSDGVEQSRGFVVPDDWPSI